MREGTHKDFKRSAAVYLQMVASFFISKSACFSLSRLLPLPSIPLLSLTHSFLSPIGAVIKFCIYCAWQGMAWSAAASWEVINILKWLCLPPLFLVCSRYHGFPCLYLSFDSWTQKKNCMFLSALIIDCGRRSVHRTETSTQQYMKIWKEGSKLGNIKYSLSHLHYIYLLHSDIAVVTKTSTKHYSH